MKQLLRETLLKKRASLSRNEVCRLSGQIASRLINSLPYQAANKIGLYHAVNGEADPAAILEDDRRNFYLPVLSTDQSKGIQYVALSDKTNYTTNRFAIPEPVHTEQDTVGGETLDLVVVPLVGFDRSGNRLGMGGGFYDRCFGFKNRQQGMVDDNTLLVGFAYEFQEITGIDPEPWDVRLDYVVTDQTLIKI